MQTLAIEWKCLRKSLCWTSHSDYDLVYKTHGKEQEQCLQKEEKEREKGTE